ncbi:MAG: hypothetical protein WAS21_14015 [Geminicoccaceae bacterium]
MSATEAIYIKTATQVVSRSRVRGRVTRQQFETALAQLEAQYEILRAILVAGHFVERPPSASTPLAWLSSATTGSAELYDRLLNAELDLTQSIYSVHVIDGTDGFDIFLLTTHAVTDATSLVELHSFLIYLCDCAVCGLTPEIPGQPFPPHIDDAVDHCLALLGDAAQPALPPADYTGDFLLLPKHGAAIPGQPVRHRLECMVVEPEDMTRLAAAGHSRGVSVHALLMAALALAIRDLSEVTAQQILVRSSIDLRRRLEPHLSTELVFSAITGHVTYLADTGQPIYAIARTIFEDIHDGSTNGKILNDYKYYPRTFGDPRDVPVAINVSDMGKVAFHAEIAQLTAAGFEYALGWLKKFPNMSVSIFDGRLIANTVYVEEFVAPEHMARLSALTLGYLRQCEPLAADAADQALTR